MPTQAEKAALFARLHIPGDPVLLVNIWDAGTARAIAASGAKAIATGSHAMAEALGYEDGEAAPFGDILWSLERITAAVSQPVTHDLERGFGDTPAAVAENARAVVGAGAVGINMEDSLADESLRDIAEQAERLAAAKQGLCSAGFDGWLNARTDIFRANATAAMEVRLEEISARSTAYAEAGADSLFVPFVRDIDEIAAVCKASTLPVNAMRMTTGAHTIAAYAGAGVARISHGPFPWFDALAGLKSTAEAVYRE